MSLTNSQRRNRARKFYRRRLFEEQAGKCCYCGCEMIFREGGFRHGEKVPVNLATLEHFDDRWDPQRGTFGYGVRRTALACNRCNNQRAKEREAAQPKENLWMRSGRLPQEQSV